MKHLWRKVLCILVCTVNTIKQGFCNVSADVDLTYNQIEWERLLLVRQKAVNWLTEDYEKDDRFLIRFLRAKQLDVDKAVELVSWRKGWRKHERIDQIMEEKWNGFDKDFPIHHAGYDLEGKPVMVINVGAMDFRRAAYQGKLDLILRRLIQMLEWGDRLVREEQSKGRKVTRFHVIVNAKGFNSGQHLCSQCTSIFYRFSVLYDLFYPLSVDTYWTINAPQVYHTMMGSFYKFTSKVHHRAYKTATLKSAWEPQLRKFLPNYIVDNIEDYD